MKKHLFLSAIFLHSLLAFAQTQKQAVSQSCSISCFDKQFAHAGKLQQLMDSYTSQGIPGIAVALYNPSFGYWAGDSGYASIENKNAMQPCHLQYAQSVSKTYTAVILLQMREKGLISLNLPASDYLPDWVNKKISYTNELTVRMYLNHSSGLPDYADDKIYVLDLLQNPLKKYTTEDFVNYIVDKKRLFEPGSHYSYCNMNTGLAALIADKISGDHALYMKEHIFQKRGLQNSFYHSSGYLDKTQLVNSYWDRYSNGVFENVTQMQVANVGNMIGDDGLVATPLDYINFLKGLFEEKLIGPKSLDEMKTQVKGKDGKLQGGLGLFKFSMGVIDGYGHGGAGIGAGCLLLYIPVKQTCVFLSTNIGTITESPFSTRTDQLENELPGLILQ